MLETFNAREKEREGGVAEPAGFGWRQGDDDGSIGVD